QALAPSATHVLESPCTAQGSVNSVPAGPPPPIVVVAAGAPVEPLPPTPTLPAPHAQSHGAHADPGVHVGQMQVHVLPVPLAPPPQVPPPPLLQLHAQGGQVCPGGQAGQAHVQVPPPPAPPFVGALEQSHTTAAQSAFAGHATGCTQVQPPPEAPRA